MDHTAFIYFSIRTVLGHAFLSMSSKESDQATSTQFAFVQQIHVLDHHLSVLHQLPNGCRGFELFRDSRGDSLAPSRAAVAATVLDITATARTETVSHLFQSPS